jgi:hypothetical protein
MEVPLPPQKSYSAAHQLQPPNTGALYALLCLYVPTDAELLMLQIIVLPFSLTNKAAACT